MVSARSKSTPAQLLAQTGNDYSGVAREFQTLTGLSLVAPAYDEARAASLRETVSVVIPSYNGHRTLTVTLASLARQLYRNFEVIVVDDGSDPPLAQSLRALSGSFAALDHVAHSRSRGIGAARNTGIACASGTTIVLLDDDMRVGQTLTYAMALRMAHTDDCLYVGFRETVEPETFFSEESKQAHLAGDWRCRTRDRGTFLCLTARPCPPPARRRAYRLLDETADFRAFGHGRVVGYWDLPQMVVGHSMAAKKDRILGVGGFDEERVQGWGTDDLVFGAQMIAAGHYVVPAREWVSLHPRHDGRKSSRHHERTVELSANFRRYREWVSLVLPPTAPTDLAGSATDPARRAGDLAATPARG